MLMKLPTALLSALLTAALGLGAAFAPVPHALAQAPAKPAAAAQADLLDVVRRDAAGFSVGPLMSARVVYVFFDMQCPHCATLWQAAKPLTQQTRFVWIPVRLLGPSSQTMGSALLASKDPIAAMNEHESSRAKGGRGIDVNLATPDGNTKVDSNSRLFQRLQARSVPFMVYKDPRTGAAATQEGAMDTQSLKAMIGA